MSFSSTENASLDTIFHRLNYKIDRDGRWGDLCVIKNDMDQPLLHVHRPLGYAGLIFTIALLASLIVIGMAISPMAKVISIALILLAMPILIEFQPKRAFSFYADAEHKRLVFRISQVKGDQLWSRFFEVRGLQNELIATIKNDISLGQKTIWNVSHPSREIWVRVVRVIPWMDMLKVALQNRIMVMQRMKNDSFQILKKESSIALGEIDGLGHLNLKFDPEYILDRRVALALSVVMRSV